MGTNLHSFRAHALHMLAVSGRGKLLMRMPAYQCISKSLDDNLQCRGCLLKSVQPRVHLRTASMRSVLAL